jgi:hypothetical protein
MHIDDFIWLPDFVEKIYVKHHVTQDEAKRYSSTNRIFALLNQGTGKEKTYIPLVARQMQAAT